MNINASLSVRGGSVSADLLVGRGSTGGVQKKSFAAKLASIDTAHQRLRSATSASQLSELLDEYILLAALLAKSYPSKSAVPGGTILSAAIKVVDGHS